MVLDMPWAQCPACSPSFARSWTVLGLRAPCFVHEPRLLVFVGWPTCDRRIRARGSTIPRALVVGAKPDVTNLEARGGISMDTPVAVIAVEVKKDMFKLCS